MSARGRRRSGSANAAATRRIDTVEPYAPFDVQTDAAALGLVTTTVRTPAGSCVARHRPLPASPGRPATVLLHGAAGSWTTWTPLLAQAGESGIRIENPVLLDLPGWGDATIEGRPGDVRIDDVAALVEALLTELGYREWHLVGHSLGGFVALHLAATHQHRVRSVGMVSGTTFSVIRSVAHPVRNFREVPAFTMLWRIMQLLVRLGTVGSRLVRAAHAIGLLRVIYAPLFRHGLRVPRSLVAATSDGLRPRAFAAAAEITRGYDARAVWSAIRCPVRAVRGDHDVFVTERDLDELGEVIPHSERTVIADCGHFAAAERPRATLEALGFGRVAAA